VPPTDDDAPLDAIEQVWVRMWARIVIAEMREQLAQAQRSREPAASEGEEKSAD